MAGGIKKIKIFVASSNELKADRDEFRLYISSLNDIFIEKEIYMEIIQWEYFRDAISRTSLQDEYNKALRNADMALCLFFSKVGKFTEEEFFTAYTNFKSTGKPLIWTYFKSAPLISTTITREIDTLLSFKEKLNELGHYYTVYDSPADLKNKFREQLDLYDRALLMPANWDNSNIEPTPVGVSLLQDKIPEQSTQLSKVEILNLVDSDLEKAFKKLHDIYSDKNIKLNDISLRFSRRADDNSLALFRSELKRFVSKQPDMAPKQIVDKKFNEELYKALCELDFKTQTDHFCEIFQHKKIAPFILYGQSEQEASELKWLYKQLMNKAEFTKDSPIIIDMKSKLGGSFDRLLDEFYTRFNVYGNTSDDDDLLAVLKDEIQKRLENDHLVCVIKNAGNIFANPSELNKVFNEFMEFLRKNIVRRGHEHSLIFLFMQDTLPVELCRDEGYFLWFDKSDVLNYPIRAYQCKELKIFDLAPVGCLVEDDITTWFKWVMKKSPITKELSYLFGKEKDILGNEGRPLQVIQNICSTLKTTLDEQWIS